MTTSLTAETLTAHRPGVRSWLTLIGCEIKMVVRDTAGLIVPLGLPMLILLTSALAAGDYIIVDGLTALDLFVMPLVIVTVLAMIGIVNMPSFLAMYRRTGILRRLSATPASPAMVLAAQVIVSVMQAIIGIGLAVLIAALWFHLNPPVHLWQTIVVVGFAALAMYCVGMLVAAISPTPNSAVAIGLVLFFAVGALGGLFGGREALPDALATIGGYLPFGAAIDAIAAGWAGQPLEISHLLSLGITTLVGITVSALFFRWE